MVLSGRTFRVGQDYFPPLEGESVWPHVSQWQVKHWERWLGLAGWPAERVGEYLAARSAFGLGVQVKSGPNKGKIRWLYQPTPKQVEASRCPAPNLLYGGAAGGAKSHWLRWDFYKRCLAVPGYRALILRRTFPELERTHMREAMREAEALGAKYTDGLVRFENGSLIEFGHCQDDKAVAKYLSAEYDAIGPDEAATFEQDMLLEVMSRARSTKPGVMAVVRATSNPGGAHTLWLRDFFILRQVDTETYPFYQPSDYAFIPSRLYDNPWLMDADGTFRGYEKRLGVLSPERRKQLLEGDWTAISGQFFPEWREQRHVAAISCSPVDLRWFCSMDWGYANPGCVLWWACLPDGHFHIAHERKFQGLVVHDVAALIKQDSAWLGLKKPPVVYADPAMWQKTGQVGESIGQTLGRLGVPVAKAQNDRENGWQRVRELLHDAPDGTPWLTVSPKCAYLIRTLPTMVHDTNSVSARKGEDLNTEADDHAVDALRYGAMSWPTARQTGARKRVAHGSLAWWKREPRRTGELARN